MATLVSIQTDQWPNDEGQSQAQGNLVGTRVKRRLEANMGLTSNRRNTH